jgi:steroid delta-isomerase-like uncharacterized protein
VSHPIIDAYFAAYNQRRWDAMVALCTDDVIHDVNEGGREIGAEPLRDYLERTGRCYEERLEDLAVMTGAAGRYAIEWTAVGRYVDDDDGLLPARGQHYRLAGGTFLVITADRISRITTYYNLQSFLDQIV